MNLRHFLAIAGKELKHILRDGQTLAIVISLPVVMMFLFGYALKSELEEVPVILVDPNPSAASKLLAESIEGSTQFHIIATVPDDDVSLLTQLRARAMVRLAPDFSKQAEAGLAQVSLLLDGSDPATATTLRNAFSAVLSPTAFPTTIETQFLFNPEQRSSLFFVPGLMATILAMIGALLTSITITREKESGTLANLQVSRLQASSILLGKLTPYFGIAGGTGVLILLVGRWAFGVEVQGSIAALTVATVLYLLVALGIGLLISTVVQKQQHAMLMALGLTMMPTIMLSGFVFPLSSLPLPLQYFSKIVPATWYLQMVRGIILKGVGFAEIAKGSLVLALMALILLTVATKRFQTRLK